MYRHHYSRNYPKGSKGPLPLVLSSGGNTGSRLTVFATAKRGREEVLDHSRRPAAGVPAGLGQYVSNQLTPGLDGINVISLCAILLKIFLFPSLRP